MTKTKFAEYMIVAVVADPPPIRDDGKCAKLTAEQAIPSVLMRHILFKV